MRVGGHCLYVALSRPPQGEDSLVLSNLPYDLDTEELLAALNDPLVEQVRLVRNQQGRPKGYAYVAYRSSEAMMNAFETLY